MTPPPPPLVSFAPDTGLAQTLYREFVEQKVASRERLWDKVVNGIYLGREAWLRKMRKVVESKPRSTDHPKAHRAVGRPKMDRVIAAVAKSADESAGFIRSGRGGVLRRLAAWIGWNEGLLTLRSIAASLRLRSEGHVSGMIRRCEREFGFDRTLLAQMDGALAMLRA